MFEGFTEFRIPVQDDISIFGIHSGSDGTSTSTKPALLLLHGFPQTHHIWHLIAPQLTSHFTIIALDLRGYGSSSKPRRPSTSTTTPPHHEYAKSTMANDCVTVMRALGHSRFFICAHDRGARVAHKLCVDYPEMVRRAMFLDICPTLAMYAQTDQVFATAYFHWFLLIQEEPLPEGLIGTGERARGFLGGFMRGRGGKGQGVFDEEAMEEYLKVVESAEAVHAMCEDYRAGASIDLEEAREDIAQGRHVQCPLRVLWGKKGVIEKCFDAIREWKAVHQTGEVTGESVDCGHYIPEEKPDVVVRHIKEFFV